MKGFSIVKLHKNRRTHKLGSFKSIKLRNSGDTGLLWKKPKKFNEKYKFGLCFGAKKLEFKLLKKNMF